MLSRDEVPGENTIRRQVRGGSRTPMTYQL
jgi:hypothetical protein